MPSDLKPTTPEERSAVRAYLSSAPAGLPISYEFTLRLIADVDGLRQRLYSIVSAYEQDHTSILVFLMASAREVLDAKD